MTTNKYFLEKVRPFHYDFFASRAEFNPDDLIKQKKHEKEKGKQDKEDIEEEN